MHHKFQLHQRFCWDASLIRSHAKVKFQNKDIKLLPHTHSCTLSWHGHAFKTIRPI